MAADGKPGCCFRTNSVYSLNVCHITDVVLIKTAATADISDAAEKTYSVNVLFHDLTMVLIVPLHQRLVLIFPIFSRSEFSVYIL